MLQTEYSFDTEFAVIVKEEREACILLGIQKWRIEERLSMAKIMKNVIFY